ncbi:MAG: carboxylesterase family protein [Actinomycetota bacterium]
MNPVVETAHGRLEGRRERGVESFKGIPFAAPPVGPLRFTPPQPAAPWTGSRDCGSYGPVSLQHTDPLSIWIPGCEWNYYTPDVRKNEDCLNLNVWTPACDDGKRAVYVWLHGGGFVTGSGTALWYDGTNLAAGEDVVVVTVNYRLGALGGLVLEDAAARANTMLLDQIAALQWVRTNIEAFGGDPARVTLGGESAGGIAVCALMAAPEAHGLFRAAAVQSGHGGFTLARERAGHVRATFLAALGLADDGGASKSLRELHAAHILDAQAETTATIAFPFRPVDDGDVLPAPIDEAFASGSAAQVPLLIGTNRNEHNLFAALGIRQRRGLREEIAATLVDDDPETVDELTDTYAALAATDAEAWNIAATERDWRSPVRELAAAHADRGAEVFQYEFALPSPVRDGVLGASHAMALAYTFGNLDQPGVAQFTGDDAENPNRKQAQQACVEAWGSFIRDGRPASERLPHWPAYSRRDRDVMVIDAAARVERDPNGRRVGRWAELETTTALDG